MDSGSEEKKSNKRPKLDDAAKNGDPEDLPDWKTWRKERREQLKKWKEERVIKKLQKHQDNEKKKKEEQERLEDVKETKGRTYTVSIAVSASILDNAQSPELRCYLAGQIARAACIFNVDEIILFDESNARPIAVDDKFTGVKKRGNASVVMGHILQYLECPQYLRKHFFPIHQDLQYAGLLNPLDSPHHLREEEDCPFREGVVTEKPHKEGKGSYINVGLTSKFVQVDKLLQPGIRVTVRMLPKTSKKIKGEVVAPSTPRLEQGLYWGYDVRIAKDLSAIFTGCPFPGGYDLTIGTSENGISVDTVEFSKFNHMLVVFGGVQGIEAAVEADEKLTVDDPSCMFNFYVNTCPNQSSRTIRTEEALLITLSAFRPKIQAIWKR